jgi:hypothetical protein
MIHVFFILSLVLLISCEPKVTYDNHKLLRLTVTDKADLAWLADLYENNHDLDFWIEPFRLGGIDIGVPPSVYPSFTESLKVRNIPFSITMENIQEVIELQLKRANNTAPEAFVLTQYNTIEDINDYLLELENNYPGKVQRVVVGSTYEGRNIYGVRVGNGRKNLAIWLQAGIHAREWIAPATCLYMLTLSLTEYEEKWNTIYDEAEMYWIPSLNVDGYVYSRDTDRMWRKTRRPNSGSTCIGTDANRNYGYGWGGPGSGNNPCAENYRGGSAFTEPEVRSTTNYLLNTISPNSRVIGFMCLHSYSQLWLSAWGYVYPGATPDYDDQQVVGSDAINALASLYGTSYVRGPISDTLYEASGCSVDWGYGQLGVILSYTPELRDTGTYGFLLPENQIEPSGYETEAAIFVWVTAAINS